jgi:hypothetical protein
MQAKKHKPRYLFGTTLIILVLIGLVFMCVNELTHYAAFAKSRTLKETNERNKSLCDDAVQRYLEAEKQGDKKQIYIQAWLCEATFTKAS